MGPLFRRHRPFLPYVGESWLDRLWSNFSRPRVPFRVSFGVSCSPPLRTPSQEGGRSSGSPMVQSLTYPPPGVRFESRVIQSFPLAPLSAAWESYLQRRWSSQSLSLFFHRRKACAEDRGWSSEVRLQGAGGKTVPASDLGHLPLRLTGAATVPSATSWARRRTPSE